jgi:prepilin-type N-terminal cleavage/methylation domain-containing protein
MEGVMKIRHNIRDGSRCPAFTLVELLVVISIIAMLLAVLMPALGKARDQGKKTICKSNVHGLGLATLLYLQSNDNAFPAPAGSNKYSYDWYGALSKYTGVTENDLDRGAKRKHNIFVCPASNYVSRQPYRDYATAWWSPAGTGGNTANSYGVLGYYAPSGSTGTKRFYSRKLTNITKPPATYVWLAEFPNDSTYSDGSVLTSSADTFIYTDETKMGCRDRSVAFLRQFARRHDKGKWEGKSGDSAALSVLFKGSDNALMADGSSQLRIGSSTQFLRSDFCIKK